jgi:hypothetical protein
MASEKLKIARTDAGNLVANLRGEVGEVITTWLLMRHFMGQASRLASGDLEKDVRNRDLLFLNLLADKLRDELIGRLSELAEARVGQLTFYFAAKKLGRFAAEAGAFTDFVVKHRLRDKRNRDVSHKHLPERWSDHRNIEIPYRTLVRAVALGLRLIKRIDRHVLGPAAPYSWRQARKRRYDFISPPRAGYMLVPYLNLSPEDRIQILRQELKEGTEVWAQVPTTINGQPASVLACKKWGIVALGNRLLALEQYPLIELGSITVGPGEPDPEPEREREQLNEDA